MMMIDNNTQLDGRLTDLTVYSSNFAELKDLSNPGSKVKYRVSEKLIF